MSIQPVGSYLNLRGGYAAAPVAAAAPANNAPTGRGAVTGSGYAGDAYGVTSQPQGSGVPSGMGATSGGLSLGRMLSWAGGAFGAFKLVASMAFRGGGGPGGWALAATLGAGAFAGNWLYNKLTGK